MKRSARIAILLVTTVAAVVAGVIYPLAARSSAWESATFQRPIALFGLLLVPLLLWWGSFGQDGRTPRMRIGTVVPLVTGPRGLRTYLRDVPAALRAVAVAFLVVAMARPVSVLRDQRTNDKGIDIVLVMDLSGSMRAILDADARTLPGLVPNLPKGKRLTRLDTAKIVVNDFISRRRSDRIGVVVFGKSAFILSPPTLDYHLLTELVSKLTLGIVDGTGTAIGDAVGTAAARLKKSDAQSKVVLLLTDGDSNAGLIAPDYATHLAQTVGAKVYTIQIGNGDEVEVEDGVDLFGQPHYSREHYPVNPELLAKMAKDTGGASYVATDAKALADSMHAVLDQLEKTRFEASMTSFEDLFPLVLVPGVLLVALDALLRAWLLRRFP